MNLMASTLLFLGLLLLAGCAGSGPTTTAYEEAGQTETGEPPVNSTLYTCDNGEQVGSNESCLKSADLTIESYEWVEYAKEVAALRVKLKSNTEDSLFYSVYVFSNPDIGFGPMDGYLSGNREHSGTLRNLDADFFSSPTSLRLCFWKFERTESEKICTDQTIEPIRISFVIEPSTIEFNINETNGTVSSPKFVVRNDGNVKLGALYPYRVRTTPDSGVWTSVRGGFPGEGFVLEPNQEREFTLWSTISNDSCDYDDMLLGITTCEFMVGQSYNSSDVLPDCKYARQVRIITHC